MLTPTSNAATKQSTSAGDIDTGGTGDIGKGIGTVENKVRYPALGAFDAHRCPEVWAGDGPVDHSHAQFCVPVLRGLLGQ